MLRIVDELREKDFETHNRQVALNVLSWRNVASQWSAFIDKVQRVD
jgi:hypothetical protein